MTLQSMKNLIDVYDAASELWELSCKLTGSRLESSSVVSELLKVSDVINRESSLYEPGVDWEDSPVRLVLDGGESAVERAKKLLAV